MKNPREPFARIDVQAMKTMMERGEYQVIDTRNPDEFVTGHVAGSLNIPYMAIVARQNEIDATKQHLFICRSGNRSAVAAEFAAACGFTELYNIEGGMLAWEAAGFPIETGPA